MPASASACSSSASSRSRAPSTPRWCGELPGPRTSASAEPSSAHEREVGLRVAAVDGERQAHRAASSSERLEEGVDQLDLPDQRVREQRLARDDRVARRRSLDREPLVRGDVLDEPEQLRRERRLRQRLRAVRADPRRHLDDVVGREPGERAAVAHVDDVDGAVVRDERRDEPDRRLAVVRAAALLEQRRLLRERRVAVHAPAARARSPRPSARAARRPAARRARGRARRSSAGSTTGIAPSSSSTLRGSSMCSASSSPCSASSSRQDVAAVDAAPPGSTSGG